MKRFAKLLALFLLVVVVLGTIRAITTANAADSSLCFGPGNNLIDNIDPKVMENLRKEYNSKASNDDCWLTGTFLFRPNDIKSDASPDLKKTKLQYFFDQAQANQFLPIIRVGSENGGDIWPRITPDEAETYGQLISEAMAKSSMSRAVYVELGNEVNADKEWYPGADPKSYALSLVSFAEAIPNNSKLKIILPPLILNPAAQISYPDYYKGLYQAIKNELLERKLIVKKTAEQQTKAWINSNISGYGFNLYPTPGDSSGANIPLDFQGAISALGNAGFDLDGKVFIITELGVENGIYRSDAGALACQYYRALQGGPYGQQILTATIFSREQNRTVHAFLFPNGLPCQAAREVNKTLVNIGGSTSFGGNSGYEPGRDDPASATFPPLGTLQSCPAEIPIMGTDQKQMPAGETCGVTPKDQPEMCKDLKKAQANPNEFCSAEVSGFCFPDSCTDEWKGVTLCGEGKLANPTCEGQWFGRYIKGACLGDPANPWFESWKSFQGACFAGKSHTKPDWEADRNFIEACLGNLQFSGKMPKKVVPALPPQFLPACVPTTETQGKCVSECSEPIDIVQDLKMTLSAGCYHSEQGSCYANIKIKEKSFNLPIAKELADYLAGTLDAELTNLEDLKKQLAALSEGSKNPDYNRALQATGVVRKLLPEMQQDKLKCQFIDHVKEKKAKMTADLQDGNYDDSDRQTNTKYVWVVDGEMKEMMVFDKKVTEIPKRCDLTKGDYDDFDAQWGKYWAAIPLFTNEDAAGMIQFVSPSLFNKTIAPINVSIPEINRLNSVSAVLQSLLVPYVLRTRESKSITYGKTIDIYEQNTNVCRPKPIWANYYSDSEFQRAVLCKVTPNPISVDGPDSEVCTVGPDGVINCLRDDDASIGGGKQTVYELYNDDKEKKVQVRTVFPDLYEISDQSISFLKGFFHIFRPMTTGNLASLFTSKYDPIPAESKPIHYELTDSRGLRLEENPNGWKVFFYNLGGVWTARNFVLDMLTPKSIQKEGSN